MNYDLAMLLIFIFGGMLSLWLQLLGVKPNWTTFWLLYASVLIQLIVNYGK